MYEVTRAMNLFAVDIEAGMAPGKQALRPLRAEKLPADEKGQHQGQNPRVLQEKVRRCSVRQSGQRIRANPRFGLPQSR
jgi:hypothetical protein